MEVGGRELVPPVPAGAIGGLASQVGRQGSRRRVDDADGHAEARLLDRVAKVAVVGDDHRGLDPALQQIDEEVGGDVDVRALLLPVGVGDHELRPGTGLPEASCTITGQSA